MKHCQAGLSLIAVGFLLLLGPALRADNWPQWRGPTNDGISTATGVPTEWDEKKNMAWKLPLPGSGGSTPALWGDRLFLTTQDQQELLFLCVSTDGKELWRKQIGEGAGRFMRDEGNNASASPCTDGKHVWVQVGNGTLACFDLDGKEVWKFNLQDRYGKFRTQHGWHNTPLLDGERLYVELIHTNGAWVLALDKNTGKEIWKVHRESDGRGECLDSYTSPVIWRNGKDAVLITHGCDYAIGHRLEDGKEIWRVGGLNPSTPGGRYNSSLRFVASPVATPELIVIPTAKNGPVVGLKPTASGLVTAGSEYEYWRRPRDTPDVPSPLVHDGLVYLCRENGLLICMDAKTGKEHYSQRIHSARYRASPVYADGKIYLTARDGTVSVVRAGPKFELLATNKLPDQLAASPVIVDGRIYLRGFEALYAIGSDRK